MATLKGLRGSPVSKTRRKPFRVGPLSVDSGPRVAKAQPWDHGTLEFFPRNPARVASSFASLQNASQRFQRWTSCRWTWIPGLPKRNPGLQLANAFSVKDEMYQSPEA